MQDRIEIVQGDITQLEVDAIANAANEELMPGSGVCGAIHRAAGSRLWEECSKLRPCATGDAKITKGYNLFASWVIHTVGPVWQGGNYGEDDLLASCYRRCLELAVQYKIKTVAFPAISTGVYGFPMERACKIALGEVNQFLQANSLPERVILVCFDQTAYDRYLQVFKEITET